MDKIIELEHTRRNRVEAEKLENIAFSPLLIDTSHIKLIYNWYKIISKEVNGFPKEESNAYRQRFIFIILLIYSPGVLLGDKMPNGLRKDIAKAMVVKCDTVISNNCANVMFNYHTYRDFRSDVDYLWYEITFRIQFHGL